MNKKKQDIQKYVQIFKDAGEVRKSVLWYAEFFYPRFVKTKKKLEKLWKKSPENTKVLEIGSLFFHQSLLYRLDGYEVTCTEREPLNLNPVNQIISATYQIPLVVSKDLSKKDCFSQFEDSSFDVILFTEILEHLTFNPVRMWKEIYRILKPGGRIILTTPNYYSPVSVIFRLIRWLFRLGGGLSVEQILTSDNYDPHWKEYSLREVKKYFRLLSPDFKILESCKIVFSKKVPQPYVVLVKIAEFLMTLLPFLRMDLFFHLELTHKDKGIVFKPNYHYGDPSDY